MGDIDRVRQAQAFAQTRHANRYEVADRSRRQPKQQDAEDQAPQDKVELTVESTEDETEPAIRLELPENAGIDLAC